MEIIADLTCIVTVDNGIHVGIPNLDSDVFDTNENPTFLVYPNPGSGKINIKLLQPEALSFEICVVNQYGALVHRERFTGQTNVTLNLTHLPTGLYLVTMQNKNGIYSDKVIINND